MGRKVRLGKPSQFLDMGFIGGAAVRSRIPGAIARGLRWQMDIILPRHRVRPLLKSQSRVREVSDNHRFKLLLLAWPLPQLTVIDPGSHRRDVSRCRREEN